MEAIDIRSLDEWMYAIHTALSEIDPEASREAVPLLRLTLDQMREHRAQLLLHRQNELGF